MNAGKRISFGPYRLDLDQRMLFRGTEPVSLTPRLFDLLVLFTTHAGCVVSKDEILREVWGQTVVEDGTITWHLHALRQALANGDDSARYIDTVPKRGYRFIAPIVAEVDRRQPANATPAPSPSSDIATTSSPAAPSWRAWRYAAAAVLIVVASLAFFAWRSPQEPALPYAKRDWLMIGNFENQTGEARFDRALFTALTISLEQSQFVNVFPRSRVATTLERMRKPADTAIDEALAREVCLREGLRALITPSITRTGKEYAVAARLMDPKTGNTVRAYLIRAPDENRILSALQELAQTLRRDLGESFDEIHANNRPLEQVTTPVLTALQQYSEGMELWDRARYYESTQKFEAALDADPDFAMAHAAMGNAKYSNAFNRPDLGNEYFQRALALASRTTARERQLIAADFAASRGHLDEARELYRTYAAQYPDDLRMHAKMGSLFRNASQFEPALAAFRAAVALDPDDAKSHFNIGVCLANQGDFVEARKHVERAAALDPGIIQRGTLGNTFGFILFGAGDHDGAEEYFRKMAQDAPRLHRAERALGLMDMYLGRYAKAAEHFRAAIAAANVSPDTNLSRSRNHGFLASVLAAQGDHRAAQRELDLGVASLDAHGPTSIEFRARFANAYARLGNLAAASKQLDKAIASADAGRAMDRAILAYSRGELELARGEHSKAVASMRAALAGEPGTERLLILEALARACDAASDAACAADAYGQLVATRGSWLSWEAQEHWLTGHVHLARIEHARGQEAKATAALQPLLALWKDADADLPVAQEARRLGVALKNPAVAAR